MLCVFFVFFLPHSKLNISFLAEQKEAVWYQLRKKKKNEIQPCYGLGGGQTNKSEGHRRRTSLQLTRS